MIQVRVPFKMFPDDNCLNERSSLGRLKERLTRLTSYFGENTGGLALAEDRDAAHILARKPGGAANATINRELSAFKGAFRLGGEFAQSR